MNFSRTDIPLANADSVAIGDLDGVRGPDIAIALWQVGSVGVMLNNGDGTFGALTSYPAGPPCVTNFAVDITLGDVVLPPDGKLDAYVACSPYVVRLTGDGAGGFTSPTPFNIGVAPYNGTTDMLALVRRANLDAAPQLAFQHQPGALGSQVCITDDFDTAHLVCDSTPAGGPLAVGDLNGAYPGVPPDEIITGEGGDKLGFFGFAHQPVLAFSESSRIVPGGVESAAVGDLDADGDNDVLVGQYVNSVDNRVASIHFLREGAGGLDVVATPLLSTAGLDDLAIADVDGDGCNDVVAAGGYGRGMVHLADGTGGFDGGRDLPQIGYQNPSASTRVRMAVGDLTGDGLPELLIVDKNNQALMLYRNASTSAGGACVNAPPVAIDDAAVLAQGAAATTIDVLANDSDPDGDPLSVASVTQPAHGTAAIAGGAVTYRPAAGYCNDLGGVPDTFTYTLNGGGTATVAVTVQCVTVIPPVFNPPVGPGPPPPPPPPPAPRTCDNPGTDDFTVGTSGDDVLVGTSSRDVINGRGGDDCLFGLKGEDFLRGGTGADRIDGATGDDRLEGDAGADLLTGSAGSDLLRGGDGDDKIRGGNGNDEITPGAGNDTVTAQGGNDTISARDNARDTIDCGAGVDKVTADRTDVVKNCEYVKRAKRRG